MRSYIAVVHKEDGTSYGIDFPDFPGAVSAAETAEGAARELLAVCLEQSTEDGQEPPEPIDLDVVRAEPERAGAYAFLWVPAQPAKGRAVRVTITMDENLLAAADAAAAAMGETRSGFLANAARFRIGGAGADPLPHKAAADPAAGKPAPKCPAPPRKSRTIRVGTGRERRSKKG